MALRFTQEAPAIEPFLARDVAAPEWRLVKACDGGHTLYMFSVRRTPGGGDRRSGSLVLGDDGLVLELMDRDKGEAFILEIPSDPLSVMRAIERIVAHVAPQALEFRGPHLAAPMPPASVWSAPGQPDAPGPAAGSASGERGIE